MNGVERRLKLVELMYKGQDLDEFCKSAYNGNESLMYQEMRMIVTNVRAAMEVRKAKRGYVYCIQATRNKVLEEAKDR